VTAGAVAGLLAGLSIGGVGGRIAMLVLRLTSDSSLHGRLTDDGFTIGVVSSGTLFLLGATAVLGAAGGALYLLVRSWFPTPARPWLFGTLAGLVGGSAVIRPGGIDFTLLEPLWLAVVMFVALPAAYGFAVSVLAERLLERAPGFRRVPSAIGGGAVLLVLVMFGIPGIAVAVGAVGALALRRWAPPVAAAWTSAPMTWLGRAAVAAICVEAAIALEKDVVEILGAGLR
jgi:hypothetical protein